MGQSSDSSSNTLPTLVLLIAAVLGFILSNSSYSEFYSDLLKTSLSFQLGDLFSLNKTLLLFINDGLMAIFFLFVGLELKRELVVGELSEVKKAILPIVAAVGGMLVPALFYFLWNPAGEVSRGWGIPMATDIAFALGVLTLLGSRVPKSLKVLLAAIAIVDDLGAILVIALFYTSQIAWPYLFWAFAFFFLCVVLNRLGVLRLSVYMLLGILLWYFMLKSGVHATIAGVLLAMTIPLAPKSKSRARLISDIFNNQASPLDSPAVFLEKSLLKWVSFVVLPIFAFANSGVSLGGVSFGTISFGVIMGLFVGKPLGIAGFAWVAEKFGFVSLPDQCNWQHLIGLGSLAGIGFTMSLFIGSLAFSKLEAFEEAKLAILIASFLSAFLGIFLLLKQKR